MYLPQLFLSRIGWCWWERTYTEWIVLFHQTNWVNKASKRLEHQPHLTFSSTCTFYFCVRVHLVFNTDSYVGFSHWLSLRQNLHLVKLYVAPVGLFCILTLVLYLFVIALSACVRCMIRPIIILRLQLSLLVLTDSNPWSCPWPWKFGPLSLLWP